MPRVSKRRSAAEPRASMTQTSLADFLQPEAGPNRSTARARPLEPPSSSPGAESVAPKATLAKRPLTTSKQRGRPTARRVIDSDGEQDGASGSESSDLAAIGFVEETDSSVPPEDEISYSPKRPTTSPRKIRRMRAGSVDKGHATEDSDPEPVGIPVFRKKSRAKSISGQPQTQVSLLVESEEDEPPVKRRKLVRGVRPPTPEEDPLDEVESDRIIQDRLRTRDKKSRFQQNLEKYKRKKQKQPEMDSDVNSQDGDEQDSSAGDEDSTEDEDRPFSGARPDTDDSKPSGDSEDEGLSGFIEEDSGTALELPTEFSMNTFQDLMHHFKIICQLFVHLAVQDVDDRQSFMEQTLKDRYFSVPLQIARRKLTGLRDSTVASSVWRPNFKKVLEKYPEFEEVHMEYANPGCDACHISSRLSTIHGRVQGVPYDRLTFEPLAEEDEDSEDDSQSEDEYEAGPMQKEFELGRFCARRTRIFHKLTHWEYALFKGLAQEIDDLKNKSSRRRVFVPVAYAGGAMPPDDLTDGDAVMNWLDERGFISVEWHKIKEMMEDATNIEAGAKGGDAYD